MALYTVSAVRGSGIRTVTVRESPLLCRLLLVTYPETGRTDGDRQIGGYPLCLLSRAPSRHFTGTNSSCYPDTSGRRVILVLREIVSYSLPTFLTTVN
jgi:hypothetical protein